MCVMDKDVSVTGAMAAALWLVGGALVAWGFVSDLRYMGAGLWFSGLGGVLWMRVWFCRQGQAEHNAFIIGREVGAERAGLRVLD